MRLFNKKKSFKKILKPKGMKRKHFRRQYINYLRDSVMLRDKEYYLRKSINFDIKHNGRVNAQTLKKVVVEAIKEWNSAEIHNDLMKKFLKEKLLQSEEVNEDKKNMEEKKDE